MLYILFKKWHALGFSKVHIPELMLELEWEGYAR